MPTIMEDSAVTKGKHHVGLTLPNVPNVHVPHRVRSLFFERRRSDSDQPSDSSLVVKKGGSPHSPKSGGKFGGKRGSHGGNKAEKGRRWSDTLLSKKTSTKKSPNKKGTGSGSKRSIVTLIESQDWPALRSRLKAAIDAKNGIDDADLKADERRKLQRALHKTLRQITEVTDFTGQNCLHNICRLRPPADAVALLVQLSPALSAGKDCLGRTPLHVAAGWSAGPDVVRTLLNLPGGALAARAKDSRGQLPLHFWAESLVIDTQATKDDAVETLKRLVRANANIVANADTSGMTALDYAQETCPSDDDILMYLERATKKAQDKARQRKREARRHPPRGGNNSNDRYRSDHHSSSGSSHHHHNEQDEMVANRLCGILGIDANNISPDKIDDVAIERLCTIVKHGSAMPREHEHEHAHGGNNQERAPPPFQEIEVETSDGWDDSSILTGDSSRHRGKGRGASPRREDVPLEWEMENNAMGDVHHGNVEDDDEDDESGVGASLSNENDDASKHARPSTALAGLQVQERPEVIAVGPYQEEEDAPKEVLPSKLNKAVIEDDGSQNHPDSNNHCNAHAAAAAEVDEEAEFNAQLLAFMGGTMDEESKMVLDMVSSMGAAEIEFDPEESNDGVSDLKTFGSATAEQVEVFEAMCA